MDLLLGSAEDLSSTLKTTTQGLEDVATTTDTAIRSPMSWMSAIGTGMRNYFNKLTEKFKTAVSSVTPVTDTEETKTTAPAPAPTIEPTTIETPVEEPIPGSGEEDISGI